MGKYVYEFQRFGVLFRQNGITMTDMHGNYTAGEPHWVWWWPVNWIVITAFAVPMLPIHLWRAFKSRKDKTP